MGQRIHVDITGDSGDLQSAAAAGTASIKVLGTEARRQDAYVKRSTGIWQDAAGRWRNSAGQFASAAELAAEGVRDLDDAVDGLDLRVRRASSSTAQGAASIARFGAAPAMFGSTFPMAISLVQALGVEVLQLGSSLGPAAGGLVALPAAAGIAAQGLSAVLVGFNGVFEAIEQTGKAQEATTAGATRAARVQQSAADDIARAHDQVRQAVLAEEDAQARLNEERRQAKQDLLDIQVAAAGAAISQQEAALELVRARRNLRRTSADPASSDLDVEEARIAVSRAEQSQREATIGARRTAREQREALRAGVDGADRVVEARRQLAEAERGVADANRDAARAGRGAAAAIAAQAPAVAKLHQELADLTPEARAFVAEVLDLKREVAGVGREVQRAMLPGFVEGLQAARPAIEPLSRILVLTGEGIGAIAERAGELIGSDGFLTVLSSVGRNNVEQMGLLADAGMDLGEALVVVLDAAGPFLTWMARSSRELAGLARDAAWAGRESGAIAGFFDSSRDSIELWGGIVIDAAGGLWDLGRAAKPFGDEIAQDIARAADEFNRFAGSAEGQKRLKEIFEQMKPTVDEVNGLVVDLLENVGELGLSSSDETAAFLGEVRDALPVIKDILRDLVEDLGPAFVELLDEAIPLIDEISEGLHPWTSLVRPAADGLGEILDLTRRLIDQLPDVAKLPAALAIGGGVIAGWRRMRELLTSRTGLFGSGGGMTGLGPAGTAKNPLAVVIMGDGPDGAGGAGGRAKKGAGRAADAGALLREAGIGGAAALGIAGFAGAGTAQNTPTNKLNAFAQGVDPTNALARLLGLRTGLSGLLLPPVARARTPSPQEIANIGMGITPGMQRSYDRWKAGQSGIPSVTQLTAPGGAGSWFEQLARFRTRSRDVAGDLVVLQKQIAETQRLMGIVGPRGLEQRLDGQRKALRDLKSELAFDFGSAVADMLRRARSASDKNVDAIIDGLRDLPPAARTQAADMAVGMAAVLEQRGELPKGSARRIHDAIVGEFRGMKVRSVRASGEMAGAVTSSLASLAGVVATIMGAIGTATNESLAALGLKAIRFTVQNPRRALGGLAGLVGGFVKGIDAVLAGGGFVGFPGERGRDEVHALLGRGEAVLNADQQHVVQRGLAFAAGAGQVPYGSLQDLFRGERRPHYLATGGFAGGPGRWVTASHFGGPNDPSAYGHSTASGAIANETLWGWAELSNPPSSLNFAALGRMPMGSMLEMTYHGRTVRAPKVDVGAGGGGLNGHVRAVDLTYAVKQALNFPDLADILIRGATGGPAGMLSQAIAEIVAPRLSGPRGALLDLGTGAVAAVVEGANKYLAEQQRQQQTAAAAGGGAPPLSGAALEGLPRGVRVFDGKPVAGWIFPILEWARAHGWGGSLTSGYRTPAQQMSAAIGYGLQHYGPGGPLGSNHVRTEYPGGAIDVSSPEQLAAVLKGYPGSPNLVWGGPVMDDWVHFSANGHALGGFVGMANGGPVAAAAARRPPARRRGRRRRPRRAPARRPRAPFESYGDWLAAVSRAFVNLPEGKGIVAAVDRERDYRSEQETLYGQLARRFGNENALFLDDEDRAARGAPPLIGTLAGDWTQAQLDQLVRVKVGEVDSTGRELAALGDLTVLGDDRVARSHRLIAVMQQRKAANEREHRRNLRRLRRLDGRLDRLAKIKRPNRRQRDEMSDLRRRIRRLRGRDQLLVDDNARIPGAISAVEGEINDVWNPMLSSTADSRRTITLQTIPDLQLDISELGARPPRAPDGRTDTSARDAQILALTRQLLAQSQEALAVSEAQFGVFDGMMPLVGRYDHGTRFVPQTGIALVHRGEQIVPDPEGAFSSQLRAAPPTTTAAAPQVTLMIEGDVGPLLRRVEAIVDGRAARVVSEQLGARARILASAPGGR